MVLNGSLTRRSRHSDDDDQIMNRPMCFDSEESSWMHWRQVLNIKLIKLSPLSCGRGHVTCYQLKTTCFFILSFYFNSSHNIVVELREIVLGYSPNHSQTREYCGSQNGILLILSLSHYLWNSNSLLQHYPLSVLFFSPPNKPVCCTNHQAAHTVL